MSTKITVNGVSYDGVDAMPPDVRRLYEDAMTRIPALANRADADPLLLGRMGPLEIATTVRKKILANGQTFDVAGEMPPEARAAYAKALAVAGDPNAKKEVRVSLQINGPGFHFAKSLGDSSSAAPAPPTAAGVTPMPQVVNRLPAPIEPTSGGGGLRVVLTLGLCAAAGLAVWWWMTAR